MKFILNLLLFIALFFTDSLLAFNSTIQSGIYGTNFKDSLLSNISTNTGNYLFKKAGDIGLLTNLDDGSIAKTAIHSVVGGSINAIQGKSFVDGAIISGINELLTPLSSNLDSKEQILTSQLIGILSGAIINSNKGANLGYTLSTSAEMYNRQLHQKEIEFIKEKAQEFAIENGISKDEAISRLSSQALRQTDNLWSLMLGNEDIKAKEFLSNTNLTFKNGDKLFTADRLDYKNNRLYLDTTMNNISFYNAYIHLNISSLPLETAKNNTLNLIYNADKIPSYVYNLAKEQTPFTIYNSVVNLGKDIVAGGISGANNLINNTISNDKNKLDKIYNYKGVSDDIALLSGIDILNLTGTTAILKDITKTSSSKILSNIDKSINKSIDNIADNFTKISPSHTADLGKMIDSEIKYIPPKGGGGTTNKIIIKNQEFTFGHGGRHMKNTGLNYVEVEKIIAKKITNSNILWDAKKPYIDTIIINGKIIEFRAKRLPNGKINIGTYYEKK